MKKPKTPAELIGHRGKLSIPVQSVPEKPFRVWVIILDARTAYGRTDALVTPMAGEGQAWVNSDSIDELSKQPPTP